MAAPLPTRPAAATGRLTLRGLVPSGIGMPGERGGLGPLAQVAIAVGVSLVLGLALGRTDQAVLVAGVIGIIGLVALGFMRPAAFLLALLMLRPLLDQVSTYTIGLPGANVAGGMAVLLIVLAVALLLRRPGVFQSPVALSWTAVVVITIGSSALAMWNFGGTVGTEPISDAVRMVSVLAIFVLAANVFNSPDRFRRLVLVGGFSGLVPALWGLIEWPFLETTIYSNDIARISGPFVGPNPLGQYLALTMLILIGVPKDWLALRWRVLALTPMLLCLIGTYSRVGWIMLVLGVAVLEWRTRKQAVIGLVVVVAAVVAFVPAVNNRILPSETPTAGSAPTYESYSWRVANWGTLMEIWTKQPFLGHGTETTIYVNPRRTTQRQFAPDGGFEAHNAVVRILVEGGIALLIAYALWAVALGRSLRAMRRSRWELQPGVRLAGILWLLMLLVGLATDDPFGNTAVLFLLFAITGALEGAHRLVRLRARVAPDRPETSTPLFLPARPTTP